VLEAETLILDLGCGNKKREGTVGVDFNDRSQADIVHDLNQFPYPFEDGTVDHIYLDNVLEHLHDTLSVMEEIYRLLKKDGTVKVIVPYFRSVWAFIDPTHRVFFSVASFSYFDPNHIICKKYDYTQARFATEKIVFNETVPTRSCKKVIKSIANKWPWGYEYYLSHLFPLDDITFYLKKL